VGHWTWLTAAYLSNDRPIVDRGLLRRDAQTRATSDTDDDVGRLDPRWYDAVIFDADVAVTNHDATTELVSKLDELASRRCDQPV